MTTEQKAKAYDEVRKKIALRFGLNVAEEFFSAFEESEDDKIRKELIDAVEYHPHLSQDRKEEIFAWLKKQGEQKPTIYHKFRAGDIIRHIKQGFTCKIDSVDTEYRVSECGNGTYLPFDAEDAYELVEQKPIEERDINKESFNEGYKLGYSEASENIVEEPEKYGLQKPVEWSKEDEKMRTRCAVCLGYHLQDGMMTRKEYEEAHNWLKSLLPQKLSNMERNGKNWKPSEEQIQAVEEALSLAKNCGEDYSFDLRKLLEQLKAL